MSSQHAGIEIGVELGGVYIQRVSRASQHGQHSAHAQETLPCTDELVRDEASQDRHQVRVVFEVYYVGEPGGKKVLDLV